MLCTNSLFPFQQPDSTFPGQKTVQVIPGARYGANWLHRLFLGSHWRDLWCTPIDVTVLNLEHFAGGLMPTKVGGGRQTKSLRLKGNNGKEYKFRTLDKDPKKALPEDLQQSIAADIVQDQISSANPLAPLIVAPLLNAVGVLNEEPQLVVMPDDERLGRFREEFKGLIGTIEENPGEGSDDEPGFADADKIISTTTLYRRMLENNNEQVDAKEFLKARLMDIYLGDWDRHRDQWRWAGFRLDAGWLWKPIPKDRDQAFSRFDGIIPTLGDMLITEVETFDDHYTDVEDISWTGRYLDRHFLVSIEKPVWDSITVFVVNHLSDSVIEQSVHRMPEVMYAKRGKELERMLKSRRSELGKASTDFYSLCQKFPEIYGSDKPEYAEIHRLDDHNISVLLFRRDKKTGDKKGEPFFQRVFNDKETKEIRAYLLGGDDIVKVDGEVNDNITVRVIGGDGKDELIDNSHAGGGFLASSSTRTFFYDEDSNTVFTRKPGTHIDQEEMRRSDDDSIFFEPVLRDYGHIWRFEPLYGSSPEEGFYVGGGPILYDYSFRTSPYNYRMDLIGGLASSRKKGKISYTGEFYSFIHHARVTISLMASQLEWLNFFGFGNETSIDQSLLQNGHYEISQPQVLFEPNIAFHAAGNLDVSIGGSVKYVHNSLEAGSYLQSAMPYGSAENNWAETSISTGFTFDSRNNWLVSTHGVFLDVKGSFYPKLFDNKDPFGKIHGEMRTFLSPAAPNVTLALRVAGEKIFGTYPFFESAFLGGKTTIRGFELQRFAGDAFVYGTAEVRIKLGTALFLVPENFGISFFGEGGRVFLAGESSNLWHTSVGGGPWFSFVRPDYVISISIAHSHEKNGFYLSGGFAF